MSDSEPGDFSGTMQGGTSSTPVSSHEGGQITSQLATLVPSFDPATDNVEIWASKIELLQSAWPPEKMLELATRIVLNCKGTAYQKLQLHSKEILTTNVAGIKRIVQLVGGTWGQVPLEKRYDLVEKAVFRCQQRHDETSDSFLSRCDVVWSELLSRGVDLKEIQSYVLLRGSRLSSEDKKRVLVESGAEDSGNLDLKRVSSSIRMLGSGFFQDYTGMKKDKQLRTYDHTAFVMDEQTDDPEGPAEAFWTTDEIDDDTLEAMAAEDEDAALILQFEDAMADTIQNDTDLSAFYSTYQDARRRLSERVRVRGFWPVRKGDKGKFKGSKGKGKGKNRPGSLAQRIANSYCRICFQKGHWKDECPKKTGNGSTSSTSAPTSFAVAQEIPPELQHLPVLTAVTEETRLGGSVKPQRSFRLNRFDNRGFPLNFHSVSNGESSSRVGSDKWFSKKGSMNANRDPRFAHFASRFAWGLRTSLRKTHPTSGVSENPKEVQPHLSDRNSSVVECHFASVGTVGVVDLGASQTVIGSNQVPDLLSKLDPKIRKQVHRTSCNLVFRFGNHQTLTSHHALMLPLHSEWFRIAVVPGQTPFLLSSQFLKQTLKAVIDTDEGTLWSKTLNKHIPLIASSKNLFLLDLNHLWESDPNPISLMCSLEQVQESHLTQNTPVSERDVKSAATESSVIPGPQSKILDNQEVPMPVSLDAASLKHVSQPRVSESLSSDQDQDHRNTIPSVNHVDLVSEIQGVQETDQRDQWRSSPPGRESNESGGTFQGGDQVWKHPCWENLSRDVRTPHMDAMVSLQLRNLDQGGTCKVLPVLRAEARHGDVDGIKGEQGQRPQEWQRQGDQDQTGPIGTNREVVDPCGARGDLLGGGARLGGCHGSTYVTTHAADGRPSASNAQREPQPVQPHEPCGDGPARDLEPPEEHSHQDRAVSSCPAENAFLSDLTDFEWDFDHLCFAQHKDTFMRKCQQWCQLMSRELEQVSNEISNCNHSHSKTDLLEVMCGSQSELTKQCQLLGGRASRFGLSEGDLSKTDGRRKLFRELLVKNPTHLWFSPKCSPWCKFSNLNMSKSLEACETILKSREDSLWQVSLAVILFRFQQSRQKHFHMEQPYGSEMWKVPIIQEVCDQTQQCCFDLCRVGKLVDPDSGQPIRKRLSLCTTSQLVVTELHGKFCSGDHKHQVIEGSCKMKGVRVPRSQFTENYPRIFGRQLARILLREKSWSIPTYVEEINPEDHPTKRRRLGQKLSPAEIAARFVGVNWQTVMQNADRIAPRVGTLVVEQGQLIDMVKHMCPNHDLNHIVLCRGIDRCVGPCKAMSPGLAPIRRMISIRRRHEDIYMDPEWENWERLSNRALRRKCVASRVGMIIFARVKTQENALPSADIPNPSQTETSVSHDAPEMSETPGAKRMCVRNSPESEAPGTSSQSPQEFREQVDLVSDKHGPNFLKLSPENRQWLLKVHRNLGHPSSVKLAEFCRQLQCPKEILQGIADIRCSTCQENKHPTIARPSAIHPEGEFGDIISMDGINWTSKGGEQFHFYHFIDQSTNFHTAIVSPSRKSEHAIRSFTQGWLAWAGPPSMLVTDAATEVMSEEFQHFLQKHNIKGKTIAVDAHWQNSRIERHGGILQEIITKMDSEEPIKSYDSLNQALSFATHTKNQWSRHRGYPPETLVFGKSTTVPGSVTSDTQLGAHTMALQERPEGLRFREELALRERARRAFVSVDNNQVLRRALVHRTRPDRGNYSKGSWVMVWKKRGESNGVWVGPMRVIVQEGPQVIWVTRQNKLYRVAPEHVRPLSALEELNKTDDPKEPMTTIIPHHGGTQFVDQTIPESSPTPPVPVISADPSNGIPTGGNPGIQNPNIIDLTQPETSQDQPDHEPSSGSTPLVPGSPHLSQNTGEPDASNIPVPPSDDDDSLVCESIFVTEESCFHLDQDQAWEYEIDLGQKEIEQLKKEQVPADFCLIASCAKRQRSEVKITNLTEAQRQRFLEAKHQEIDSWLTTGTVAKVLRHQIPMENIMRCRWILTWKEVDPTENPKGETHKPKARLVVLGFEDPMVDEIPRDSPTLSKLSRMLLLQTASSNKWEIGSFDIKTAFLRGSTENQERKLAIEPPEEMRNRMNLKSGEIAQLLKGAYGRVDAPFLWFQELKKSLEALGFASAPFDPCMFVLHHNDRTEGLIGIHVDDGLCCGTPYFHEKLRALEKKFPFGSRKHRDFIFTGLHISQKEDFSIWIDQTQYVKDIHPIVLSRERRAQAESEVNEKERQSLRAVIGSLQYASVNSRPDIGSRLGWLQGQINKAKVSTLCEANRVLHEAKTHADVTIKIQSIPLSDIRYVAFSDASFASEKCHDSHQGMIIAAAHKRIGENRSSPISPIVWHSRKIQRVAVSTLSAEAMALAGAVDTLSWVRLYWAWLCNHKCNWRDPDVTLPRLPEAFTALPPVTEELPLPHTRDINGLLQKLPKDNSSIITTDCKSLYDLVSRTAPPSCQEFRTQLQAKLIKEHLQNGIQIRWVPSGAQIADALTKVMDGTILRECLRLSSYSLHDEAEILRERSDSRSRLAWIRGTAHQPSGEGNAL